MNLIFTQGPSIQLRLGLAVFFSFSLMVADHRFDAFKDIRIYLNSLVAPLQYAANLPTEMMQWTTESLVTHTRLLTELNELREQRLMLSEQLQRYRYLQQENNRLRELLSAPLRQQAEKMVVELMAVENDPFSLMVMINKGALNGLYEGQPVIDANGVVGQVVNVGSTTSRILLVADINHGVPVRVERNNVRAIAAGTGDLDTLKLKFVPHSVDIEVGDILVTSGLGGKFPEGYPVGRVEYVDQSEGRKFSEIQVTPLASLDRLKYMLLLWPHNSGHKPVFNPIVELTRGDDNE